MDALPLSFMSQEELMGMTATGTEQVVCLWWCADCLEENILMAKAVEYGTLHKKRAWKRETDPLVFY
jgi:hypothetical protein